MCYAAYILAPFSLFCIIILSEGLLFYEFYPKDALKILAEEL